MALDVATARNSVRKLRKLIRKTARRPSVEHVHDLRTHTRRLEAAIDALGLAERGNERRIGTRLARVRKRAGKVRDMDVLTADATTVTMRGERDCLVELVEHLGAERHRHAAR